MFDNGLLKNNLYLFSFVVKFCFVKVIKVIQKYKKNAREMAFFDM